MQSNRKLDSAELAELTRRGETDRGDLGVDRVEGLGFAPFVELQTKFFHNFINVLKF